MKKLMILIFISLLSCNKQVISKQEVPKGKEITFKVAHIESTDNAFFIDCERKDEQTIKLVSWKKEVNSCKKQLEVGKEYSLRMQFEEFMAGDYDGYQYDGKELPLETLIAFSNDLKGLCIKR